MATTFKAGLIQTNVSNEMAENVAFVREQARLPRPARAPRKGADRREAPDAGRLSCQRARNRRLVPGGLHTCSRAGRGADPQSLLPDRFLRRPRCHLRPE